MVMYSSASRALAGAVGMQQAIEHHNRSAPEPLAIRIGISTGEAIEEDGDYFGEPLVEAARLCAAASGGQILAAELVRLTVGRNAHSDLCRGRRRRAEGFAFAAGDSRGAVGAGHGSRFGGVAGPSGGRGQRCLVRVFRSWRRVGRAARSTEAGAFDTTL